MDNMFIVYVDNIKIDYFNLDDVKKTIDYEGLYIYAENGKWFLNAEKCTIDGDKKDKVELMHRHYVIKSEDIFYDRYLYVYGDKNGFDNYSITENKDFLISNNEKSNIVIKNNLLNQKYLFFHRNVLQTNLKPIFLNGKLYKQEMLNDFDCIEWYGIKFYYHKNFIIINNFGVTNIKEITPQFDDCIYHQKRNINSFIGGHKRNVEFIDFKVPDEKEIKKRTFPSLIEQIGPGFTMSLAMCGIAFINVYLSIERGSSALEVVPIILLPVVMMISTLVWPLVIRLYASIKYNKDVDKQRNDYLKAIDEAMNKHRLYINDEIKKVSSYFFDFNYYNRLIDKNSLFFKNKKDDDFLTLSIGYKKYYFSTSKIERNFIEYPFFIDMYIHSSMIIRENIKDNYYFISKIILELTSINDYRDLLLVLFKKPKDFYYLDFIPHLFHSNSRYLLCDEQELGLLEKIRDKKIVLISFSHINKQFESDNIYTIYYQNNKYVDEKGVDTIVNVNNGNGTVHIDSKECAFKYYIEAFDFKKAFYEENKYLELDFDDNISYSFKDTYQLPIDKIDIMLNHLTNRQRLKANFACFNDEFHFDLHEKGIGPHGLIGGTTGSGKSELIISLLFSLCMNYSPDYLNIVVIDYKGGGIVQSLSYKNEKLPHIIATISNIDDDFQRLIVGIKKECKNRQIKFNELSIRSSSSIMNIDDYNMCDLKGEIMPRLLIVIDEFAELKMNHYEEMKELISLSRIGRSLGLHLILATQKPGSSIDEEIWSNSRFKIALKVQDDKDSRELIHSDSAAYIKKAGDFYLLSDKRVHFGHCVYSRSPLNDLNHQVSLVDERLNIIRTSTEEVKTISELEYGVKAIVTMYRERCFDNYLFPKKPDSSFGYDLIRKYKYFKDDSDVVMGEIDDIENLHQNILIYSIKEGHALIVSKRTEEILTVLDGLANFKDRIIYIGTKIISHPCISDCVRYWDDDLKFFFKIINSKTEKQNLVIIFEDLSTFLNYEEINKTYFYRLLSIAQLLNITIIALTRNINNLPYRALLGFENIFAINIKDKSELTMLFKTSLDIKDGYCFMKKLYNYIPVKIMNKDYPACKKESYIITIPKIIKQEFRFDSFLIGYIIDTREKIYHSKTKHLCIISYNEELLDKYKNIFITEKNIEFIKYNRNYEFDRDKELLWVGDGVLRQHLFHYFQKEDIKNGEGIYFANEICKKIRVVDE